MWLKHPANDAVNETMQRGIAHMQTAAGYPAALTSFRQATRLDPLFPEAWNKIATILFLQRKCALPLAPAHAFA